MQKFFPKKKKGENSTASVKSDRKDSQQQTVSRANQFIEDKVKETMKIAPSSDGQKENMDNAFYKLSQDETTKFQDSTDIKMTVNSSSSSPNSRNSAHEDE